MAISTDMTPEGYALLEAISGPESRGSWNVIYGGNTFDDYSQHPSQFVKIKSGPNKGKKSSAAGKYQITKTTYNRVAPLLGITDFTPESQMKIAWYLAQEKVPNLQKILEGGDPTQIQRVGRKLSGVWTSLPGGIEQGTSSKKFLNAYTDARNHPVPPGYIPDVASKLDTKNTGAQQIGKNGMDPMAGITKIGELVGAIASGGLGIKANQFGIDPRAPDSLGAYASRVASSTPNSVTRTATKDPSVMPVTPAVKSKNVQAKQDSVFLAIDDIFKKGLQLDADSRSLGGYAGRAPAPSADLVLAGVTKSGLGDPAVSAKKALPKPDPLSFAIDQPKAATPAKSTGPAPMTFNDSKLQALVDSKSSVIKTNGQAGKVAMPADARPSILPAVKKNPLLDEMFPNPANPAKKPVDPVKDGNAQLREAQSEQKLLRAKSNLKLAAPATGVDPNNPAIKLGNMMLGAASAGAAAAATSAGNSGFGTPTTAAVAGVGSVNRTASTSGVHTGTVIADYGSQPGQSTAGLKPGERQYNADTNSWDLKA